MSIFEPDVFGENCLSKARHTKEGDRNWKSMCLPPPSLTVLSNEIYANRARLMSSELTPNSTSYYSFKGSTRSARSLNDPSPNPYMKAYRSITRLKFTHAWLLLLSKR
ncbi:unnamed protein product, partial [Sphacelaria rigidula]